ncbi:LysR family transcriptional regulator [Streptomyces violascens]|uniref:LysR family transcriptional regulator n=1 Tax=Streptomyces violascens TaxID=67381 RepID=UPI00365AAEAB
MEIRRLRYFVVLARQLHFGRAAAEIGIAQPGLSQQIKVLEKELRAELFIRGRGEVRLTAAGEQLAREAPKLLDECEALARSVRSAARGSAGVLRIAYTRSGADLRLGELVRSFRTRYPRYQIEALTGWTSWNLELLQDRTVDAAFIRGLERPRGVEGTGAGCRGHGRRAARGTPARREPSTRGMPTSLGHPPHSVQYRFHIAG